MNSRNLKRYLIIALIFSVIGYFLYSRESSRNAPPEITYSQAQTAISLGLIDKAIYSQNSGELILSLNPEKMKSVDELASSINTDEGEKASIPAASLKEIKDIKLNEGSTDVRTTLYGSNPELLAPLSKTTSLKVQARPEPTAVQNWMRILIPILLMVVLFLVISRMMSKGMGGGGKMFSFGESKMKRVDPDSNPIRLSDVQGCDEAKAEVSELISFLNDSEHYKALGAKIPRGVLMDGPPGTGKTLLAKAIAGEANVPFFSIAGSDFVEMFVGVGSSRVRDMFEVAKKNAPCIIFIDEIDAMGSRDNASPGGGGDERDQTLNQMLVQMDGFDDNNQVILIAATNRPEKLDKALRRPGRFDRHVHIGLPDRSGREAILNVHAKKILLDADVEMASVAKITTGFSGAELANVLNEAALFAGREKSKTVTMNHLRWARDRVILGSERTSAIKNEKEMYNTSVHEVGHALVAHFTEHSDPVCKVSIVPRTNSLGVTMQMPKEDGRNPDRLSILDRVAVLMAGRAAEDVLLGLATAGASNDFDRAAQMVRAYVATYGMDEKIGPISFDGQYGRNPYGGNGWSDAWNAKIDERVSEVIREQYARAKTILTENLELLKKMSNELLRVEDIEEEYFNHIVQSHLDGVEFVPVVLEPKVKTVVVEEVKVVDEGEVVKDGAAQEVAA